MQEPMNQLIDIGIYQEVGHSTEVTERQKDQNKNKLLKSTQKCNRGKDTDEYKAEYRGLRDQYQIYFLCQNIKWAKICCEQSS